MIGPKNQDYYLSRFERFIETGKTGVSWHWPAFFVTLFWLMYRKMWLYAVLYFFVPPVLMFSGAILLGSVGAATGTTEILNRGGYILWIVGYFVLPPMLANSLYFSHCRDKISETVAANASKERQIGELSVRGGTSNALWIISAFFFAVSTIGILAAVAVPAYQHYAGTAAVVEAERVGRDAAQSITAYYSNHEKLPDTIAAAGFEAKAVPSVRAITMNSEDGSVTVEVASPNPDIDGRTLVLTPSLDEGRKVVWNCTSGNIPAMYLRPSCAARQAAD